MSRDLCFAQPLAVGRQSVPSQTIPVTKRTNRRHCNFRMASSAARFRPCIDLHNGKVKQIVGGSLRDGSSSSLDTNFETDLPPSYFASMYERDNLPGGHVIMLGPGNIDAACDALSAYPGGLHAGGGINPGNAGDLLDAGASHVIVTSYVFREGDIDWDRVEEMARTVGRERLVLDVSCRRRGGEWIVCTDRWQRWTDFALGPDTIGRLGDRCDELLVHAVDVEGRRAGLDERLIADLADWATVPITYAGGVRSLTDLEIADKVGRGLIDVTVGSALDIFGGSMRYADAVQWQRAQEAKR
jgi:phosphoribosylformimino-5-aminoimidazole carboxamide ribotide isomerase